MATKKGSACIMPIQHEVHTELSKATGFKVVPFRVDDTESFQYSEDNRPEDVRMSGVLQADIPSLWFKSMRKMCHCPRVSSNRSKKPVFQRLMSGEVR